MPTFDNFTLVKSSGSSATMVFDFLNLFLSLLCAKVVGKNMKTGYSVNVNEAVGSIAKKKCVVQLILPDESTAAECM